MNVYKNKAIIYMLTSPSGKSYIGQSVDFKARYSSYKRQKENSVGRKFLNAIKKYKDIDNFKLTILEMFDINEDLKLIKNKLDNLEIFYIKTYDTFNKGYNLTFGGESSTGSKRTPEQIETLKRTKIGMGLGKK